MKLVYDNHFFTIILGNQLLFFFFLKGREGGWGLGELDNQKSFTLAKNKNNNKNNE